VFLFHPRVLQRLVRYHLGDGSPNLTIPPLGYYLMPREVLLIGLEDENPDALSVIEGLNRPDWLIINNAMEVAERFVLAHSGLARFSLDFRLSDPVPNTLKSQVISKSMVPRE
jgi:hypothetical protein